MRRQKLALFASIAALVAVPALPTFAFPYVAKRGETLAMLSLRFYGRVDKEKVLVTANGLRDGAPVVPGTRLEVPTVSHHRVERGETWESLAELYLGEPKRAEALALGNETMPWLPVESGREIVVPYVLRVVSAPGDSTPSLAYSYLGHRDDAYMVDRFNSLNGRPLKSGDVLLLPISDLALTDEGVDAARAGLALSSREAAGDARDAQLRADTELPLLAREVQEGRWVAAITRGNQLLGGGVLSDPQTAHANRLLLEAYVALDEEELARTACDEWRRADPDSPLDPIEVSPKVLRACAGTSGGARYGAMGEDAEPAPSASAKRPSSKGPAPRPLPSATEEP
ncbi:MAG: LysM peptidoglycan-binding domain-containing protein [Polyangiaceae bacterium]|nr:LysM peptidoglycan-binding domain-containing protein [Polyangiaceae bacterium]